MGALKPLKQKSPSKPKIANREQISSYSTAEAKQIFESRYKLADSTKAGKFEDQEQAKEASSTPQVIRVKLQVAKGQTTYHGADATHSKMRELNIATQTSNNDISSKQENPYTNHSSSRNGQVDEPETSRQTSQETKRTIPNSNFITFSR